MKPNNKIKDTGTDISSRSKADQYWKRRGFTAYYRKLRQPALTNVYKHTETGLYHGLTKKYGIAGIEFGNWVNNESRYNFLLGCIISFHDIQLILKFPGSKSGLDSLGLAFGARGAGRAMAHFEPLTWIINLTRHSRGDEFGDGGGIGALAHEYGHFLDYWFGTNRNPKSEKRSLTMGRTTTTSFEYIPTDEKSLSGLACKIVQSCIWKKGEHTAFYKKLFRATNNDYWFRHNEIFARAFEQYIHAKLKKKGIRNIYLTQSKYESFAYPDALLQKQLTPLFDKLINLMRKAI